MNKALFFIFGISMSTISTLVAQEFKANVTVNTPRLQNADPTTLNTLKAQIEDFYNNTSFTGQAFQDEEKIEINFTVFVKEDINPTTFKTDIMVQTLRPVYNSDYSSPILNWIDKDFTFTYTELQPIQNNKDSYTDPLSSLLTFYSFVILGYDYDTFEMNGGDSYFQIARNIMENVPSSVKSSDDRWSNDGPNRSRFHIINDIFNPKARGARQAFYTYHRLGLDLIADDTDKALVLFVNAIDELIQVNDIYPNSQIIQMFTDAKRDELIEITKGCTQGQREKVYKAMVKLDPARADQYEAIQKL